MKKYIEIEHRKDWTYANWIKIRPYIMQKFTHESLDSLISEKKEEIKKLRRDKKLSYLKKYYREVLKPQRAKRSKTNP